MNRRQFVRATSLLATAGSVAAAPTALFAAQPLGSLLHTPEKFLGRQFRLDNGKVLTLDRVESTSRDARWNQWELHFAADDELGEGVFRLSSGAESDVVLYVQGHGNSVRASISRLA